MQAEKKCCLIENTAFCKMLKTHLSMSDICHYLNVKGSNKRPREIHYKCKINTSRKGFLIKTNNNNKYDSADNKSSKVACMNACKKSSYLWNEAAHIKKFMPNSPIQIFFYGGSTNVENYTYSYRANRHLNYNKRKAISLWAAVSARAMLAGPGNVASSGVQVPDWCLSEYKWQAG